MISVHLGEDLELFIREAVRTGPYTNHEEVISDALTRLRDVMNTGGVKSDRTDAPSGTGKKLTKQEFQRHLVKIGLLDQPPEIDTTSNRSRGSIEDDDEIVDEVMIRERLIEWLTGFLEK